MLQALALVLSALAALLALALWYAIVFPRQPVAGPLPALTAEEAGLARRLATHVTAIARTPRNLEHAAALEAAARYIETTLAALGYAPSLQPYTVNGHEFRNIEVAIEPASPAAAPTIVVGAHYDSAGDSPGANDNATGVAALLELARLLADAGEPRTHRLRLVFWTNEEHPYAHTPDMGSYRHAKRLSESGEAVAGAISLETLGYFSDAPGSQRFPRPFDLIYADRGNFVAFVGLPGSRAFVHRAIAAFRRTTGFPSIGGVAPDFIAGIDDSDHWSYRQFGFPAFMLTDTAPFRNPQYHLRTDLPETVDYESLARITKGVERMLRELAR